MNVETAIPIARKLHGEDQIHRWVEVDEAGRAWITRQTFRLGVRTMNPAGTVVFFTCATCERYRAADSTFHPSHQGSTGCRSGAIAAGGNRSHCTCDGCF